MMQYRASRGAVIAWRQSEFELPATGTARRRRGWVLFYGGRSFAPAVAAASSGVTIAPTLGHAVATGHAPGVSQPITLAPSKGAAVYLGHAPGIAQPQALAPSAGHAVATGYAPGVEQPTGIAPAKGAIVALGYAPGISQPRTIAPSAGHGVFGGYTPVISQSSVIAPGKGAIIVTGYAPTLLQPRAVAPSGGSAVYAGHAPGITQTPGAAEWPDPATVLAGITYGPTGADYTGTLMAGMTTAQAAQLLDMWQRLGLDPLNPQVTTATSILAGGVSQTIAETAGPTITVTRAP